MNLEEFEIQATTVFKNGSTDLNGWFEDQNYTPICKTIIDSPNAQFYSVHFCILVLKRHVDFFFHIWDPDLRIQFCEWLFSLSISLERFLSTSTPLLGEYSVLTSLVLASGFDNDPRFPELLKIRTSTEPASPINNKICLNIFKETPQCMKTQHVTSFSDGPNTEIIRYAINSIRMSPQTPEIIESALNVIQSCLKYCIQESENKPDDFQNQIITIDQETKNILIIPAFIEALFTFSQNGLSVLSFEILRMVLACQLDLNLKKRIFEVYVLNIIIISPMKMDSIELNHFYRLVLRLQSDIVKSRQEYYPDPKKYDENPYFQIIKQVTIRSIEFLNQSQGMGDDQSIIEYIFSFYTLVDEKVFPGDPLYQPIRAEFMNMKLEILSSFVMNTLSTLDMDDEIDIEKLGLNTSQYFPAVFESLNTFTKNFAPEALKVLFTKIPEGTTFNFAQLAFVSNVTMCLIKNHVAVNDDQDIAVFSEAFSNAIFRMMSCYHTKLQHEYVIDSFLLFARHFKLFSFLCNYSPIQKAVYSILQQQVGISSISEMLQSLLELLSQIFNECDDENHIIDACNALTYLFENNSFSKEIPSIPFVQNLVTLRVESPFPFLLKMNHSQSRTMFHSSIANILVRPDSSSLRERYLSIYDTALTEPSQINAPESGSLPESLWGFLCDFTGFFEFAHEPEHFSMFFSYLFYKKHFDVLEEIIPKNLSFQDDLEKAKGEVVKISQTSCQYQLLIQLLKFWDALLNDNRKRIQFRHHEDTGLRLFRYAVNALKTIVGIVKPVMAPGADITRKTICYVFKIMNSLFQAGFGVPFYSFDYFKDPILMELLSLFNECLGASPPTELVQYPKLELILVQLTRTICEKQLEVAAKPELNLMETLLHIINATMRSLNKSVRDNSIKSFEAFTKFEGVFIPKPAESDIPDPLMVVISQEAMLTTTFQLLDIFFVKGNEYNVINCIKEIFRRLPKLLEFVHAKMSEFLLKTQDSHDKFEQAFGEFSEKCGEMYSSGNTSQFATELKKFKDVVIRCLSAPTKVFL